MKLGKDEGRDTVREDGENYIGEGMREEMWQRIKEK